MQTEEVYVPITTYQSLWGKHYAREVI